MRAALTTILLGANAVLPCASLAAETAPTRPSPTTQRPLDLRAPQIGKIFSLEEINAVLSRAADPSLEHVEVEALPLPDLPMVDSLPPAERLAQTVTWLFAPSATFEAIRRAAPDATYSHRPPPALQANYHASFAPP